METIEQQVREALIEKRAKDIYEVMQEPKCLEQLKEFYKDLMTTVATEIKGQFAGQFEDEETADETVKELVDGLDSEINAFVSAMISEPEQLKRLSYEQAKNQYITIEELKEKLEKTRQGMDETGDFNSRVTEEFLRIQERLFKIIEYQDRIIAGIAAIAEKQGIEAAMSDSARYDVIRHIFPTKEEFIQHNAQGMEELKKYLADSQRTMQMDGETGKVVGAFYGGILNSFEKLEKLCEIDTRLLGKKVSEEAEKIYG